MDSSAHVQLMRVKGDGIRDWQPLLERLSKVPHVVAAAPELDEQVLVAHGARDGDALIEGVIPEDEMRVSRVLQNATPEAVRTLEPRAETPAQANAGVPPIVLGKDLADSLGVECGRCRSEVISPQGDLIPMIGIVPKYVHFRLVGTYHTGFYQYDSAWGYVRLADAQRLYDEPDLVTVDQLSGGRPESRAGDWQVD